MALKKDIQAERRKKRVRSQIIGKTERPRLSVFRSNKYLYAQIIDDGRGVTLVSVSEKELDAKKLTKMERSKLLGELLAQKALKAKIEKAVFDRSSNKYHGRLKAFVQSAREKGLII
jgi:large subunit ribosomal protein L18